MTRKIALLAALAALAAVAGPSPSDAAETFKIDPVHSTVMFRVKHFGASYFYGRFNDVKGSFTVGASPSETRIETTVNPANLDTNNEAREDHLRGPDFFNVKQYPTISFKSTSAAPAAGGKVDVTGELTLHGVTKPVVFRIEPVGSGKGMKGEKLSGFEGVATIKRSDFGVKGLVGPLGDEVTVIVSVEGNHP